MITAVCCKTAEQCCATVTILGMTGLDTVSRTAFSTVWRSHLGLTKAIYSSSGAVFQKSAMSTISDLGFFLLLPVFIRQKQ